MLQNKKACQSSIISPSKIGELYGIIIINQCLAKKCLADDIEMKEKLRKTLSMKNSKIRKLINIILMNEILILLKEKKSLLEKTNKVKNNLKEELFRKQTQ